MAVLVLIPTYQRPETLFWSLKSVLLQKSDYLKELDCKIVVLNHDLSTKSEVSRSVDKTLSLIGQGSFRSVQLVHRDPPILGTDSLWRGMAEHTKSGDIAFVHCDDDIMCQGSLEKRIRMLDSHDAAFLITRVSNYVYFFINDENIYINQGNCGMKVPPEEDPVLRCRPAIKEDLVNYSIPFLSVYGYKIGDRFWDCYHEARRWADALPLEPKTRYPFLPFYMGLSAWKNSQLMVCPENTVMRGQLFRSRGMLPPKVITEYANTGIVFLTGLAVLNNAHLSGFSELDDLRKDLRMNAADYIISAFYKRNGVSLEELFALLRLSNFKLDSINMLLRSVKGNGKRYITTLLGLSNLRRRIRGWGVCTGPEDFWMKWNEGVY